MQIQECNICYMPINEENPGYYLNHDETIACGNAHIFDEACILKIEQSKKCPFCRSSDFDALLVPTPPKAESFYEKYRTREMGDLAFSPALMIGLQRVSSFVFNYVPINGLGRLFGESVAAAFGGYVSLFAAYGAIVETPWGSSSEESLVNGTSMLAGLAATHFTLGFDDWGTKIGAALMLTSAIANIVFSPFKQSRQD